MKYNEKLVSIIIPVKETAYLQQALNSVLIQYPHLEVIIVVDGKEIEIRVSKDDRIKVVRNNIPIGPGLSRNKGLKIAKGRFIAFLDADDYWEKDFIISSIACLKSNKDLVAVLNFSNKIFDSRISLFNKLKLLLFNFLKDLVLFWCWKFENKTLRLDFIYLCQISHILIDRKKISKYVFDKKYKYCEDWKFLLDISKNGKIAINPSKKVNFRYWSSSYTLTEKDRVINKKKYYIMFYRELKKKLKDKLGVYLFDWYFNYFLINKS